jgi:hypothetical protein
MSSSSMLMLIEVGYIREIVSIGISQRGRVWDRPYPIFVTFFATELVAHGAPDFRWVLERLP